MKRDVRGSPLFWILGVVAVSALLVRALVSFAGSAPPPAGDTAVVGTLAAVDVADRHILLVTDHTARRIRVERTVRIHCGPRPLVLRDLDGFLHHRVKVRLFAGRHEAVATDIVVAPDWP